MSTIKNAGIKETVIRGGFWQKLETIVRESMLPFQWAALNDQLPDAAPSHCVENFRLAAGEQQGEFYGCVFQDSDIGKWLEEAAYTLMTHPDPELEARMDEVIDLIGRAQQPDGYLNTYYTVKEPGKRFTNFQENHELYCAGHLMEGAVAVYQATGKRKLLDIMMGMARCIDANIGPAEEGKIPAYPGHPEIELALMRMYEVTGEEFLYKLAKFFIDARGTEPDYFDIEQEKYKTHRYQVYNTIMANKRYGQHHMPVRQQRSIEGHSVRALYLLSGMIDVAVRSGDQELMEASHALFENTISKRMYVTGGVGSSEMGESFTLDYDLPNDTVYAETCASIALIFAAERLFRTDAEGSSVYGDVIERALYNTCMAGMSLDGKSFFYVNPLEVDPAKSALDGNKRHVLPHRPAWFGCACCPPNLARLMASIGKYIYASNDDTVYVNQFIESSTTLQVGDQNIVITQETCYPFDGAVSIKPGKGSYQLRVRIPAWSRNTVLKVNGEEKAIALKNGYAVLDGDWKDGDVIELVFDMRIRRVYANAHVSENAGKVAIMRGPLVYCAEQVDNGKELHRFAVPKSAMCALESRDDLVKGIKGIVIDAVRCADETESLYSDEEHVYVPAQLRLIPYYAWANREVGEMRVWFNE